jgi:hypothetical protein
MIEYTPEAIARCAGIPDRPRAKMGRPLDPNSMAAQKRKNGGRHVAQAQQGKVLERSPAEILAKFGRLGLLPKAPTRPA